MSGIFTVMVLPLLFFMVLKMVTDVPQCIQNNREKPVGVVSTVHLKSPGKSQLLQSEHCGFCISLQPRRWVIPTEALKLINLRAGKIPVRGQNVEAVRSGVAPENTRPSSHYIPLGGREFTWNNPRQWRDDRKRSASSFLVQGISWVKNTSRVNMVSECFS